MKYLFIFGLVLWGYVANAQSQQTLEKLEAAKIALITERLELTPEDAEKFWPIYNEYSQKQRDLRVEFNQLKSSYDPKTASNEENQKALEAGMIIKQKQVDLDQTYTEKMQSVISARQIMSLQKAEQDFREMLMERIRQQQLQREQQQNERLRNDENMRRKRNN